MPLYLLKSEVGKNSHVCFDLNDVCQKQKEAVSRGMTFTFSHFPTQILQTDPHSPLKALGDNFLSQHHLAHTEVKRSTKIMPTFFFPLAPLSAQTKNEGGIFPICTATGKTLNVSFISAIRYHQLCLSETFRSPTVITHMHI